MHPEEPDPITPEAMAASSAAESLASSVGGLVASLQLLAGQAVADYRPIVEAILQSGSRDIPHIDRTLDGLLDFCFGAEALLLYKQLCRHYFPINPATTAEYVYAYRRMWDSEGEDRSTGG